MDYPIPLSAEEILDLKNSPVDAGIIASAIAAVVKISRQQGQSLEDIKEQVMLDDSLLDQVQRKWLSEILVQAWHVIP
jgi:hypothetical protein